MANKKLPNGRVSVSEICRWAKIDPSTRSGWVQRGLVRFLGDSGADLEAALETVAVAVMARELGTEHAQLAWQQIGGEICAIAVPPELLDVVWFEAPPGARTAETVGQVAALVRERSRLCMVIPLATVVSEVVRAFAEYQKLEWSSAAAARRTVASRHHPHQASQSKDRPH